MPLMDLYLQKQSLFFRLKVEKCLTTQEPIGGLLDYVITFLVTEFFFENAKIWVGRTTLNGEKKGEMTLRTYKSDICVIVIPSVSPFTINFQCWSKRPIHWKN